MRKTFYFFVGVVLLFYSCDKGCQDLKACNYGIESEDCKYPNLEESMLSGSWSLIDIYDSDDMCLFSGSLAYGCELDQIFQSISIIFNEDKTFNMLTDPFSLSNAVPNGNWSINICQNILNFSNNTDGFNPYLYPDFLPFGNQTIIQISNNIFVFEDLAGNTLRWEKI